MTTETPTPDQPPAPDPEPTPPDPDDELAGLDDRARRLVERANTEAAKFRHDARRAEEKLTALERKHESEQEKAIREAEERGAANRQGEIDELTAGYERRLATMGIRAKAADRFNDPDDAVLHLPLDSLLSEQNEDRRNQKVDKALADLLEAKPYLGRQQNGRQPLVTQGGRSEQPGKGGIGRSWLRG